MTQRSLFRESTLQTEIIEVIIVADQGILDDGIQRVDHILPDGQATDIGARLHAFSQAVSLEVVVNNHVPLVSGYASSSPGEPLSANDSPI